MNITERLEARVASGETLVIATHQSPDWDALGFVFVLEAAYSAVCGLNEVRGHVHFIPAGQTDAQADFVGDTGLVADGVRNFDHHQLRGEEARTSATYLMYEAIQAAGLDISHLFPLVRLIDRADWGHTSDDVALSRELGIHALLAAQKAAGASDYEILAWARQVWTALAGGLWQKAQARRELEANIVSAFDVGGIRVAVLALDAPRGCTAAAYEAGHDVVFYQSTVQRDGVTRHLRGAVRRTQAEPLHLGNQVEAALARPETPGDIRAELAQWFQHPAGFMAGVSEKAAGGAEPMAVSLTDVARVVMG